MADRRADGFPSRVQDWEARLARVLEVAQTAGPLVYGAHDCVRLACTTFEAVRGDGAGELLGLPLWHDEASAFAAIRGHGGTLAGCVANAVARVGLPHLAPADAFPGDIGLAAERSRLGASVCVRGFDSWVTVTGQSDGLAPVQTSNLVASWEV